MSGQKFGNFSFKMYNATKKNHRDASAITPGKLRKLLRLNIFLI